MMWNNDMTYCGNELCKRENCKRHWTHTPEGVPISSAYLSEGDGGDCKYYYPGGDRIVNVSFPIYEESELYKKLEDMAKQKRMRVEALVDSLLAQRMDLILTEELNRL